DASIASPVLNARPVQIASGFTNRRRGSFGCIGAPFSRTFSWPAKTGTSTGWPLPPFSALAGSYAACWRTYTNIIPGQTTQMSDAWEGRGPSPALLLLMAYLERGRRARVYASAHRAFRGPRQAISPWSTFAGT